MYVALQQQAQTKQRQKYVIIVNEDQMSLDTYALLFTFLILFYIIGYRYFMLYMMKRPVDLTPNSNSLISVIIPVYNEDPSSLELTLDSVYLANGNKEVFVVDDGSTNIDSLRPVYEHARELGFKVILLDKNCGKREAQSHAIFLVVGDYIATIDSDTSIEKDSLVLGATYLDLNVSVGAVTGQVRARNREANILTKMIDARYFNAFMFERKSQSSLGMVTCCCGSMSLYRTNLVKEICDDYVNQQWLGKKQNFGDDRHLTNKILMEGYDVVLLDKMLAWTDVPTNFFVFMKQQLRWNQSFVRENVYLFPWSIKNRPLIALEIALTSAMPFLALPLRLLLILFIISFPQIIGQIILAIFVTSVLRNVWLLEYKEKSMLTYNTLYGVMHFVSIYWLIFVATFKVFFVQDNRWGTRITSSGKV